MNAGNGDNTIGGVVGKQTNGVPSISPEAKVNQEHPNKEIGGMGVDDPLSLAGTLTLPTTSTIPVIRDPTKPKEEPQTKNKPTSAQSNTDLARINGNKSGGVQPPKSPLKRLTTVFKNFNLGNRKQQLSEDVEKQAEDNSAEDVAKLAKDNSISAMDQQTKSEEGGTIPVGDNTKRQQDLDHNDFHLVDHVETESPEPEKVSDPEKRTKEPEKVPKHETEIATLKEQLAGHNTAIASLQELVAENTRMIASLKAPSSPSPKPVLREDKVTTSPIQERPGEGLVFRKADGLSLTDVANLVGELNSQIDQTATLIMDLLRESSSPGSDSEIAGDELHNDLQEYLGSWLCNKLQHRSDEHEMVAQIALQAGLVYACSRVINDWNPPFWAEGLAFSRVYNNIARVEGPITADTWKALARNHMGAHNDQLEANKKYLEEVLLKLIIAVSGSQQSGESLLQQCHEKMDDITKKAIDIHQAISQETRSTDLSTFTVESGADFDQSRMEDTEKSAGPSPSKVVCTVEMGLRSRKRVPSRQQSGDGKVGGVTLKAKVVLFATLGEV